MFVIIGIVIVFGSIVGGYLLEHGKLMVLFQPAELVIIGGSAFGTIFISNPLHIVKDMFKGILSTLKPSPYSRSFYLDQLRMIGDIFQYARKQGLAKLEADIDEPDKSELFKKYPKFIADKTAFAFFCDTVRMSISGGIGPFELDQLMELDLEIQHHEHEVPATALNTVADALPGLGIVAAVLGVVITMGALGGPPEEIGHKVAAALVGTFLGILLCYGLVGPLASNFSKQNTARAEYLQFLRMAIVAFIRGLAPQLVVEFARRAIPTHTRPSFTETEQAIKGGGAAAAAAPAPEEQAA